MRKLKLGIVGLNRGLSAAMQLKKFSKKVEISAIADLDEKRVRNGLEKLGDTESFSSLTELLEKGDVEAVYLATPIPLHADTCIEALAAGKHVLSEVTALADIRDAGRLVNAVSRSGKRYMLAENYCYIRPWEIVRNMAKQEVFGEVFYAEGDYLMDFTERSGFPYIGGWRQNIYHMHRGHVYITHSLGPLMQLFDEPLAKVCCMGSGSHPRSWGLRADNTCNLLLQTVSGRMIRLRQDFLSPRPHSFLYYGFQGTKGAYEGTRSLHGAFNPQISDGDHRVYIEGLCKKGEWRNLEDFAGEFLPDYWKDVPGELADNGYDGGTGFMFDAFAQAVLDGAETPIPLSAALNWTLAGLLSERSADLDGAPVEIPPVSSFER